MIVVAKLWSFGFVVIMYVIFTWVLGNTLFLSSERTEEEFRTMWVLSLTSWLWEIWLFTSHSPVAWSFTIVVTSKFLLFRYFPCDFVYRKIHNIFPTSGAFHNIARKCLAKTFCKHNLFSNNQICSGFSAQSTWIQWPNQDRIAHTMLAKLINSRKEQIWYKTNAHNINRHIMKSSPKKLVGGSYYISTTEVSFLSEKYMLMSQQSP